MHPDCTFMTAESDGQALPRLHSDQEKQRKNRLAKAQREFWHAFATLCSREANSNILHAVREYKRIALVHNIQLGEEFSAF